MRGAQEAELHSREPPADGGGSRSRVLGFQPACSIIRRGTLLQMRLNPCKVRDGCRYAVRPSVCPSVHPSADSKPRHELPYSPDLQCSYQISVIPQIGDKIPGPPVSCPCPCLFFFLFFCSASYPSSLHRWRLLFDV